LRIADCGLRIGSAHVSLFSVYHLLIANRTFVKLKLSRRGATFFISLDNPQSAIRNPQPFPGTALGYASAGNQLNLSRKRVAATAGASGE
jgi:hypothetical protein